MRLLDALPPSDCEKTLSQIWQQVLDVKQVGIDDNFFELGGDSLLGMQMISRARHVGMDLSIEQLLDYQTIAGLLKVASGAPIVVAEQGLVRGPMPLTPRQVQFFEENPRPYTRGTPFLFASKLRLDPELLSQAIRIVVAHHDGLRTRFTQEGGYWHASIAECEEHEIFRHIELSSLSQDQQDQALGTSVARLQDSLDLARGPLCRVALVERGIGRPQLLIFVIHHLLFDGFSPPILVEDLGSAYEQVRLGQPIQLPAKTTSIQAWTRRLTEYSRGPEVVQQLSHWKGISAGREASLPIDYPGGVGSKGSLSKIKVRLESDETQTLVHLVPRVYGARITDVLLLALLHGFAPWTGSRSLLLDLRSHGRDSFFSDIDVTRTVGWFTVHYPVVLDLGDSGRWASALQDVQQQLSQVPTGGIGYGVLRYLHPDPAIRIQMQSLPKPEVSFNYKGRFGPLYSASSQLEGVGTGRAEPKHNVRATTEIRVSSEIFWRELEVRFVYHESVYARATIVKLVERTMDALRDLLAECEAIAENSQSSSATG